MDASLGMRQDETYSEYAYRILRDRILRFELKPGELIGEKTIAEELGISRTPVHEAVGRLQDEFLIDIKARKESRVSMLSVDLISEGLFMRQTMDAAALKAASLSISPEIRRLLQENLAEQEELVRGGSLKDFLPYDDRFHELIYIGIGRPTSYSALCRVSSHLTRMRYLIDILHSYDYIPDSIADHRKILEMIAFGIPREFDVDAFIRNHMKGFQDFLPEIESSWKEYFTY